MFANPGSLPFTGMNRRPCDRFGENPPHPPCGHLLPRGAKEKVTTWQEPLPSPKFRDHSKHTLLGEPAVAPRGYDESRNPNDEIITNYDAFPKYQHWVCQCERIGWPRLLANLGGAANRRLLTGWPSRATASPCFIPHVNENRGIARPVLTSPCM